MAEYEIHLEETGIKPTVTFCHKLSWIIGTDDCKEMEKEGQLNINLPPLMAKSGEPEYPHGYIIFEKDNIGLHTFYPPDIHPKDIKIEPVFTFKTIDGLTSAVVTGELVRDEFINDDTNFVYTEYRVNSSKLFQLEEKSFILELEVMIVINEPQKEDIKTSNTFKEDILSICHDVNNSDVTIEAEGRQFKCHKIMLCARSKVFKNMLAENTLESISNIIVMKENTAEAVEVLLKHIYTGELPDEKDEITIDVLHIADMYQLDFLKEACLQRLVEGLTVTNCLSTFIMLDRYFMPKWRTLRNRVMMFMKCKAGEVVEVEDWDKFVDTHNSLAKELTKAMVRDLVKNGKEKHRCEFCIISYDAAMFVE